MGLKPLRQLIRLLHTGMLHFFPEAFLSAFEEEMRAVFAMVIADAAEKGAGALILVSLRELRDMVIAAIQVRRSEKSASLRGSIAEPSLSRREMLAALAVFLIPAGLVLLNNAPPAFLARWLPLASLLLVMAGLLTGLAKRFPRWSLAYLGLVLSAIVFLYLFQWEVDWIGSQLAVRFAGLPGNDLSRLLLSVFWQGVVWLTLLVFASGVYLLLALLPRFRPLIRRLEDDWTQLSYLLYGGSMVALMLAFDGYRFGAGYALVGVLALAAGAWGYLRGDRPAARFLSLVTGVTLAMWAVVIGKWLLVPSQEWTAWFRTHPPERERWIEAGTALVGWAWMLIILALPALLRRVIPSRGTLK